MPHLPRGLFLTDPYHLCDKNTKHDGEAPSHEMQGTPCAHMRGSNSDDYEQDGKAGGPKLECEETKKRDAVEKGYHMHQ